MSQSTTLNCQPRSPKEKGHQLRKSGVTPAIIYGRHLDASIAIKIGTPEARKFLQGGAIGNQLTLKLDGESHSVLFKDYQFDPVHNMLEHMDFQLLTAGEAVNTSCHIVLHGRDNMEKGLVLSELLTEVEYSSLPKDLLDEISIDVSDLKDGDNITVADLAMAKDEKYSLITSPDSIILTVAIPAVIEESSEEGDEGVSAEVPLVASEE